MFRHGIQKKLSRFKKNFLNSNFLVNLKEADCVFIFFIQSKNKSFKFLHYAQTVLRFRVKVLKNIFFLTSMTHRFELTGLLKVQYLLDSGKGFVAVIYGPNHNQSDLRFLNLFLQINFNNYFLNGFYCSLYLNPARVIYLLQHVRCTYMGSEQVILKFRSIHIVKTLELVKLILVIPLVQFKVFLNLGISL